MITIYLLGLLFQFYLLGKAADLIILNVRLLAERLGIKIFFIGIIIGFFTSLPELSIGVNALINNIQAVTLGNLLGGIIILFSLVLGISLVLNRSVETGKMSSFFLIVIYLFLPLVLGFDGKFSFVDGLIIISSYITLLYYLYYQQTHSTVHAHISGGESKVLKNIFLLLLGLILVVILSNLIIRFTTLLLSQLTIPAFLLGLLVFSVGTNLPEIIVTIRSWRRQVKELSMSNVMGSAMANVFIIGVFSLIKTLTFKVSISFYLLCLAMFVLFIPLLIFYHTDHKLTRREGLVLLMIYLLFVLSEIFFFSHHS